MGSIPHQDNEKPRNFNSSGATQWRWGESVLTPPLTSTNSHGSGGACDHRATSPPTAHAPTREAGCDIEFGGQSVSH